jgi:protein SCO1/2
LIVAQGSAINCDSGASARRAPLCQIGRDQSIAMALSTRTIALAGSVLVAAGLGASYLLTLPGAADRFGPCRTAVIGGAGQIGGPFTLTDETGAIVTDADVLSKPSLVYFGYTFCPDVCPVDTARNAEAMDILEERGFEVTPVFISVDPRRDTPQVLTDWTDAMHPRMIGLTGTPEQIKAAAQAYKVLYRVPENPADDSYTVDHTTFTYLMLPGSGFAEVFTREVTPEGMANAVACFVERAK